MGRLPDGSVYENAERQSDHELARRLVAGEGIETVGTAMALPVALPVKRPASKTGYSRAQFGTAWSDVDRHGCDT